MNIEDCGKKIDTIDVTISYRIIELFSAGLYSSPNKAFEELVCNSYDAFADNVAVYLSSDLTAEGAYIWVCDNGESMDQGGLKNLWNIGVSLKRKNPELDKKRLQIGQFGIGKLATYVLANKLTYICKKNGRYLATTMDYNKIHGNEKLTLDEREVNENQVKSVIEPYITIPGNKLIPFELFGEGSSDSWTFSILTSLKPKVSEIKEGRLKWVLRTALPINPRFKLFYNGAELESSKISKPIKKTWIIGKEDATAETLDFATCREEKGEFFVDFTSLKGVYGQIDLYEDSLLDGSKSSELGRSHGIFLMVRGRLVNLDDPLLGMEAFSHGVFNRTRIVVNADELDNNLTSTRESIKDSPPLRELKSYLQKKFNNEVRKFYFEEQEKEDKQKNIAYRISQTPLTVSKRPLLAFAEKYFQNKIISPILIQKPPKEIENELLKALKDELYEKEPIIKKVQWEVLDASDPIAKFDLVEGILRVNLFHPYIANFHDVFTNPLPIEFLAITEVLTEAYLYELGLDESIVNQIIRRRDNTLRELSLSDRQGSPFVAQLLKDAISDETGLEDASFRAFRSLGFEATKLGGRKGDRPDGIAEAILGFSESEKNENYSLTYDSKSTGKKKIQAATTNLAVVKKHKATYHAKYAVVIAIDYEGGNDPESSISKMAKEQQVTCIKVEDLIRLLLLSAPKQIGLKKLKELFDTCYTPLEVKNWVDKIAQEEIKIGPIKELLEIIYTLQKTDNEPPEIATVRMKLNEKTGSNFSKAELKSFVKSISVFVPGFVSIEDEKIGIQGKPDKVIEVLNGAINTVPNEMQQMYLDVFSGKAKQEAVLKKV